MITPDNVDYFLGDTVPIRVALFDEESPSTPLNITGAIDAVCTVKRKITDADGAAVFSRRLGSGITIADAANGLVDIAPPGTAAFVTGETYVADLRVKLSSGSWQSARFTITAIQPVTASP